MQPRKFSDKMTVCLKYFHFGEQNIQNKVKIALKLLLRTRKLL